MSTIKEHLFEELLGNFLELNRDIDALIISDQEGFIIAGEKRKGIDLEIVSVLTTLINPILDRMRNEFAFKKFGTASFDTDLHRLLFISIDQNTTLSIVLNNMASIDKISPYAYFFAEKVAQILDSGESDNVDISMPIFETEADSGANSGRMKQQIYQMRLDTGGLYRFKTIVIGDHEVGKTSIVRQFVERKFSSDYRATIGLNILAHTIELYGNEVNFSLWDVGAQIYFKRFRRTYYQGTQAAFIIFDLTNRESYDNVMTWYDELIDFSSSKDIPIIIVGNKVDLVDERKVKYQEGVKLVSQLTAQNPEHQISYIETSALTGENVSDAFSLIAYHYIMKTKQSEEERLNEELMAQITDILNRKLRLTLAFITENEYWSPGIQIITDINALCDCERIYDDRNRRVYEYSNGLVVKNFLFNNIDVSDSDGVFVIFDARDKTHIDPVWRNVVITIIETIKQNKVVLIGIRVSESTDYSQLMQEFNVNEYLERKMVSVLFFKIGVEYRLEIYDQLSVMFNTINSFLDF